MGRRALFVVLLGLIQLACLRWECWFLRELYAWSDPLRITVVNATRATTAVGLAVDRQCFTMELKPGRRMYWSPRVREDTPLLIRTGTLDDRYQPLPVDLTWRSHGELTIVVTDAGIALRGELSESFP